MAGLRLSFELKGLFGAGFKFGGRLGGWLGGRLGLEHGLFLHEGGL